jgi:hypothetical protein
VPGNCFCVEPFLPIFEKTNAILLGLPFPIEVVAVNNNQVIGAFCLETLFLIDVVQ